MFSTADLLQQYANAKPVFFAREFHNSERASKI